MWYRYTASYVYTSFSKTLNTWASYMYVEGSVFANQDNTLALCVTSIASIMLEMSKIWSR